MSLMFTDDQEYVGFRALFIIMRDRNFNLGGFSPILLLEESELICLNDLKKSDRKNGLRKCLKKFLLISRQNIFFV